MNNEKDKLFEIRCTCGRLLGYLYGKLKTKCPKCKKQLDIAVSENKPQGEAPPEAPEAHDA